MIKAIIFDFDGLLVDSEPIYVSANKRFFTEHGITDFSIINKLFGMRAEETFELIKKTFNMPQDSVELMNQRNKYIIEDFENGKLKMMPGLLETLEKLHEDYILAVGSSSKRILLDKAFKNNNFSHFFSTIVSGDDVTKGKPEPDIYLKVAERLKFKPEECIVIEDAPNGIISGQRAGMKTVAIPNEHTRHLQFSSPDYMIDSLKELPEIMERENIL